MRVVVGLSGGVDSAVAALLLKSAGYEVIGILMKLFDYHQFSSNAEAIEAAAAVLNIQFHIIDLSQKFEKIVIDNFCAEYRTGRTPNPCIRCNELIKFPLLRQEADKLGAQFIATGHHARIKRDKDGQYHLLKGLDPQKDQSYFLYRLTQEQLGNLLFPVGELTKSEVRQKAREFSLPNAEREESQEICFIPDNDYAAFIRQRYPELFQPGPVYDTSGKILGEHAGIANFTIGQRKGLKIAFGERRYVLKIVPKENAIVIGSEDEVYQTQVWANNCHWVAGAPPAGKIRVWAKVRSQGPGSFALIQPLPEDRIYVKFDQPQWAPTPGQAIVFWQGDEVLGGATIEQSEK